MSRIPPPTKVAKALRTISVQKAKDDFIDLSERECRLKDLSGLIRLGLPTLDYFFLHHRIQASTRSGLSFYDAITNPEQIHKMKTIAKRWGRDKYGTNEVARLYQVFQLWYGTINQFRPAFAKYIYCTLGAKIGILDFSSGWGGRCLAAMSMNIPYYGFDANYELKGAYSHMKRILTKDRANIQMKFGPSENVDFRKYRGKYDLVFTSPPYFTIEQYRRMPDYGSKEGFLNIFFRPVVKNVWANLVKNGHLALNMPAEMYDAVKHLLPPLHRTINMPIQSRSGKSGGAKELVYIWKKK
jgi:hypothetical protein